MSAARTECSVSAAPCHARPLACGNGPAVVRRLAGERRLALVRPAGIAAAVLVALAGPLPALAQGLFKVVQPDGSVTYTDRPPASATARVTPLRGASSATPEADAGLPLELRQTASRHPVTLYTSPDCPPCETARRMLQQRGIPHLERRVQSDEDVLALERLVGGRTVPSLTIGAQPLRGFSEGDWTAFLDAAGYPKESRLPRGWRFAAPTPLVERQPSADAASAAPASPAPQAAPAPAPAPAARSPGTPPLRF